MECPYCHKKAQWVENKAIYGKNYGKSYMCYYCEPCNAYVGCHNNTKEPLGTMANKELREYRIKAHEAIDYYWKYAGLTRKEVYQKLKNYFGADIHIGESDISLCQRVCNEAEDIFE